MAAGRKKAHDCYRTARWRSLVQARPFEEAIALARLHPHVQSLAVAIDGHGHLDAGLALRPDAAEKARQVVDLAAKNADSFSSVAYDENRVNFEDRQSYDYVLSGLADRTGGRYETVLTPMAVEGALQMLLGDLKSQYRLTYVPGADIKEKDRKLEVKIARPGTKTRFKKGKS